jgi:HSP20 family protein
MDCRDFFGDHFEDIKSAAKEFGSFVRDMAEEAGRKGGNWSFAQGAPGEGFAGFAEGLYPRVNSYVSADRSLVYEFLLAGFDEKSISLTFKGDRMILKARVPAPSANEGIRYLRKGFSVRDIDYREYPVPAERWNQGASKAAYRNGLLTVSIPPKDDADEPGSVKVEIQVD